MLGKILKYEWKGLKKPLIIFSLITLAVTLISAIVILMMNENSITNSPFTIVSAFLSFFLYYIAIIVCSFGVPIIIAVRFYKTCYTDQGYLTHTLPVSTTKLLNGKIISAFLSELWLLFIISLSLLLLLFIGVTHVCAITYTNVWEVFSELSVELDSLFYEISGKSTTCVILIFLVYIIITQLAHVLMIFGCISIGQLYTKHRVLGAIIAYLVLTFVISKLFTIYYVVTIFINPYINPFEMYKSFPVFIFGYLLIGVILYFVNLHMMTKKLNLE